MFNVCFSYTATNEITSAVKRAVHEKLHPESSPSSNSQDAFDDNELEKSSEDIQESDIERCLQTFGSPDIDMLVRTSGEIRLSDFMLWQSTASCLVITNVLWPEFSPHHLYAAVLYYQEHYDSLMVRITFYLRLCIF